MTQQTSATLIVDAPTSTGRMSSRRVLAYSFGDVANNLSFMMTSMFLMVYMTDIAGIEAGIAGTIYGLTKIWAGFSDLFSGQVVDRANTRWGHLRPFILFGSLPLVVVFVLLFSTPAGLSGASTVAWIFVLDALFQICYSLVNIPYGSLSAAMTQDPVDRSKLSGARSIASSVTSVALSLIVAPQFQDTTAEGVRLKFTITCIILGVVAIVLYAICFSGTREVVPRGDTKISLSRTLKMVFKNPPLLILCLGALFMLAGTFTMNAVGMYYARDVLGHAGWYGFLTLAQTVGTIFIASFVPTITQRIGKRIGYLICATGAVLGFALIYFVPAEPEVSSVTSLVIALVAWFLFGIGTGGTNALMFSMQADTVDFGEWKTGIRSEGGSYSILSFIRKVGQGVGGAAGGAIIAAFGYASGGATQSMQAQHGIRIASGIVPAGLSLIALVVMIFYPLAADQHVKIVKELNERRTRDAVKQAHGVDDEAVVAPEIGDGRTTVIRSAKKTLPIVTVFGLSGSGSSAIAPMIANALGVPYLGQRFSAEELAQVDQSALISDSGFDRWLRTVNTAGSADPALTGASDLSANRATANQNTRELLEFVENGGVVLGRNGALVLGKAVGVLNIRLVAPDPIRIERITARTGLSASKAADQMSKEDRLRAEMAHSLYQWEPNDDEYYDLVINTGSVTYKQVVEMVVTMYRSKYPLNQAAIDATQRITGEMPAVAFPNTEIK